MHSLNTNTDLELFEKIKAGDSYSFNLLYEKYNRILYFVAYKMVKNKAAAEDIVQGVFTKLWEHGTSMDISNSIKGYLFSMTRNAILNYMRGQKRTLAKDYEEVSKVESKESIYELLDKNELHNLLVKQIDQLPEQKRLIVKYKLEGLSNDEIAKNMGLQVNTVKVHYNQAIKILRKFILFLTGSLILFS